MTPEALAVTYADAFAGQRGWSADTFAKLLQDPNCVFTGDKNSFVLGQVILDEAEILTLATAPIQQRKGLARACLRKWEQMAEQRGAAKVFLEVSAQNVAARALYAHANYVETGLRRGYYTDLSGKSSDALILCKSFDKGTDGAEIAEIILKSG